MWFVRVLGAVCTNWWCVLFLPLVSRAAICIYLLVYLPAESLLSTL